MPEIFINFDENLATLDRISYKNQRWSESEIKCLINVMNTLGPEYYGVTQLQYSQSQEFKSSNDASASQISCTAVGRGLMGMIQSLEEQLVSVWALLRSVFQTSTQDTRKLAKPVSLHRVRGCEGVWLGW